MVRQLFEIGPSFSNVHVIFVLIVCRKKNMMIRFCKIRKIKIKLTQEAERTISVSGGNGITRLFVYDAFETIRVSIH